MEYFIYSSVVKVSVMRRHNTGSSIKLGAFFMSFQNVCQATQPDRHSENGHVPRLD